MAEAAVVNLLANIAPFFREEVNLLSGVREEIEYIRDEFERMTAFLRVADAREESDPQLKVWVKQVRDAALDTEDVLDKFKLHLAQRRVHGFFNFLCKTTRFVSNLKARHQMVSEVRRIKSRVVNISEGHQRYHTIYGTIEQASTRPTIVTNEWHDCRGDALLLEEAEAIKYILPDNDCGSRVIITTRFAHLASTCCQEIDGNIHSLMPLSAEDSWTLFCKKTFRGNLCPPHLEKISVRILKRCEGLPLAIVAISGVLAAKDRSRIDEWEMLHRSLGAELDGNGKLESMKRGGSRHLKLLDLRGTPLETLPDEIFKLIHLKYLSLRSTPIETIPKLIGKLENLETLDLKGTYVTELPDEILRLKKLRHLLLNNYEYGGPYPQFSGIRGFKAPCGIGSLQSLQKLSLIEADEINGNGISIVKELGRLTELRRLCIAKLRRDDGTALCSSIGKLNNLRSLNIASLEEDEILDLQSLFSAPPLLQRLYLKGRLEKLPHWITSHHSLFKVYLKWSKLRVDPLQSLQDLPNLIELQLLQEAYEGEGLCFKAGRFKRLKVVGLQRLNGLRWVKMEEGTMPHLERLYIRDCELVEEIPSGIEHITTLNLLVLGDMSDSLVSKLDPQVQDGDNWKISHIPEVTVMDSTYGYWRAKHL
ncbi:hypothetical protein Acr_20g0005290 [Actinidia rufa]|uniref:NB-ARC domain-containing disease resistance protein n=1 Tax=Actinidia rufa TaxID=165716 RepID=A0A7J0GD82_9ERIC|nr:hypothetical protein Acr_20g0005290 [Actinidia rufa]